MGDERAAGINVALASLCSLSTGCVSEFSLYKHFFFFFFFILRRIGKKINTSSIKNPCGLLVHYTRVLPFNVLAAYTAAITTPKTCTEDPPKKNVLLKHEKTPHPTPNTKHPCIT